ncbi:MAG: ABC transporter substrate-binding protein [Candidatus Methanomethyliaceae archaeon]
MVTLSTRHLAHLLISFYLSTVGREGGMNVRSLKLLGLGLALAGAIQNFVVADFRSDQEWVGFQRTLTYSFDLNQEDKVALEKADPHLKNVKTFDEIPNGEQWKEWAREAAERWNNARTGWELTGARYGGTLRVVSGEWDDNTAGQLFKWGYKCRNGTEVWTRGVIVINTALQWDEGDPDKFNPVRVIMHEFGHSLLLDHKYTTTTDIMYGVLCCSAERTTASCGAKMAPLRSVSLSTKDETDAQFSALCMRDCDERGEDFGPRSLDIWPPDVTHLDVIGYLFFNPCSGQLANPEIIKAIGYAINRRELAYNLEGFYGKGRFLFAEIHPLVDSLIPPEYPACFSRPYIDWDLERAAQCLARSGYREGLEIELAYPEGGLYEDVALLLQAQLASIGIRLVLEPTPLLRLATRQVSAPIYLFVVNTYSTADCLDAIYLILDLYFLEPPCWRIAIDGSEYLRAALTFKEERDENWLRAQELLWQNGFVFPLFWGVYSTEPVWEH